MDNITLAQHDVEQFILNKNGFESDNFLFVDIENTNKFDNKGGSIMRLILCRQEDNELFAGEYHVDNGDGYVYHHPDSFYHVTPVTRIVPAVEYHSDADFEDRVKRQQRIEPHIVEQFVTGSAQAGMIVDDWQFLNIDKEEYLTVDGRTYACLWLNKLSTGDMYGSEPFVMFPAESRTVPEYFTGLGKSFKDHK